MSIPLIIVLNKSKGVLSGALDLSEAINNYYDDYVSATALTLSIGANPVRGSLVTVRIIGGSLNAFPTNWSDFGDAISADVNFYNVVTIFYVSSTDIRIVNKLTAAPDVTAPVFTSAPTAANILETSFNVTATLNENGTVYGYLLANGATVPIPQQIIDNAQSTFIDSGSGGTLSYTGLTAVTDYDVYALGVDTAGNRQASGTLVNVQTASGVSPILGVLQASAAWYDFTNKSVGAFTSFVEAKGNYTASLINTFGTPQYLAGTRLEFIRTNSDVINLGSNFSFLKSSSNGFSIYLKIQPTEINYDCFFIGHSESVNQLVIGLNPSNQLQIFTKMQSAGFVLNTTSAAIFSGAAPYPTIDLFLDFIKSTGEIKIYINSSTVETPKTAINNIGTIANYTPTINWFLGARNNAGSPDIARDVNAIFDHLIINNQLLTSAEKQIIIDNA